MTERDGASAGSALRGGVVLHVGSSRAFVPADVALRIAPLPNILRLPGASPGLVGLALSEGVILPLVEVGAARGVVVVCSHRGDEVGLLGADAVETGIFQASSGGGVVCRGVEAPALDIDALCAKWAESSWGASWGG